MVRQTRYLKVKGLPPIEILNNQEIEEMTQEEPMYFLCMSVKLCETPAVPSTKEVCAECNEEVWMSHGTKASLPKTGKYKVLCPECAKTMLEKEKEKNEHKNTDG
jgi:hypothetical protein